MALSSLSIGQAVGSLWGKYWTLWEENAVLGAFTKLRKAIIIFFMSVCPHGTTRLPLDGFSWSLIFEYFLNSFEKIEDFVKVWEESPALYMMQANIHFSSLLAHFCLEWEMLQTDRQTDVQTIKTHTLCSINRVFRKLCRLRDKVEK
jgi:hypothetical protein